VILNRICWLAFCTILTGCGGAKPDAVQLAPPTGFAELSTLSDQYFTELATLEYTPLPTLPVGGTAAYTGLFEARTDGLGANDIAFVGNLGILVSFADAAVVTDATTTALFMGDGSPATGSLEISDAAFDRAGNPQVDHTASIGLAGTINPPGTPSVQLELTLEGDFFGPEQTYLAGLLRGQATANSEAGEVVGRFAVEQ